jgi:hypothetical protein
MTWVLFLFAEKSFAIRLKNFYFDAFFGIILIYENNI